MSPFLVLDPRERRPLLPPDRRLCMYGIKQHHKTTKERRIPKHLITSSIQVQAVTQGTYFEEGSSKTKLHKFLLTDNCFLFVGFSGHVLSKKTIASNYESSKAKKFFFKMLVFVG